MQTDFRTTVAQSSPVEAARLAIWRLFEQGYVDEDMATAGLLAVDLGTRRTRREATPRRHARTGHSLPFRHARAA